jgi:hypothetical protein
MTVSITSIAIVIDRADTKYTILSEILRKIHNLVWNMKENTQSCLKYEGKYTILSENEGKYTIFSEIWRKIHNLVWNMKENTQSCLKYEAKYTILSEIWSKIHNLVWYMKWNTQSSLKYEAKYTIFSEIWINLAYSTMYWFIFHIMHISTTYTLPSYLVVIQSAMVFILFISFDTRGRRGRDRMVFGYITT